MPTAITIEVHTTNSTLGHDVTFIGFQMLRLYWNETTQKIQVIAIDTGQYPYLILASCTSTEHWMKPSHRQNTP
jgi:hypothetical protein